MIPLPHHAHVSEYALPNVHRIDRAWRMLGSQDPSQLPRAKALLEEVQPIRSGDSEPYDARLALAAWPTLAARVEGRRPSPDEIDQTQQNVARFVKASTNETFNVAELPSRRAGKVRTALGILLVGRHRDPLHVANPTSLTAQFGPGYHQLVVSSPYRNVRVRVGHNFKHRTDRGFNGLFLGIGSELLEASSERLTGQARETARQTLTRQVAQGLVVEALDGPRDEVTRQTQDILRTVSNMLLGIVDDYARGY